MPLDCGRSINSRICKPAMERVPITLFLPNNRSDYQLYLSELIWDLGLHFWFDIPNQLREKDRTKLFQVFPQGY